MADKIKPVFFASAAEFYAWLSKYHNKETEILVGYYKAGSGKPSMTWSESVDQALCFGWIDGVRRSIDSERYQIRFTPRKPSSIWSDINIRKVNQLKKQGLMHESGLAAFEKRKEHRSRVYPHEQKSATDFTPELKKQFMANKKAWKYFQELAPGYRKTSIHWIMNAKQAATQQRRMKALIAFSEAGKNPWKDNITNRSIE